MTTALQKGLAAARHALDNGAVIISKEAHTVPAVTIQVGVRAGSIYDSDALLGLSHLTSRVLDRGHARQEQRRHCRSARRTRRVAERWRQPSRDDGELHVSVRGFRGDARAGRRDRDAAGVSRAGNREAQRRGAERASARTKTIRRRRPCWRCSRCCTRTSIRMDGPLRATSRASAESSGPILSPFIDASLCAGADDRRHRRRRGS